MILEEETFKKYGYHPKNLKVQSNKKILAECNDCGKIRITSKNGYRDLCLSCAHKGKHRSAETKRKISDNHVGMKGKHHSNATKQKMSEASKKRLENPENNSMYDKHHSDESKQKISKAAKKRFKNLQNRPMHGKCHSEETKQKMSEIAKERFKNPENNPMWKGGISFEPYCIKFDNLFRERVREYFNRCCYICGKNEIENEQRLSVHHVLYNKETCCDDSIPLFVPLCRSCHMHTNGNQDFWQEFFEVSLSYLTNNKCFYSIEEMRKLKR